MTVSIETDRVERFRAVIARRLGLQFDDAKLGWLGDVLHRRAAAARRSDDSHLARLEGDGADAEFAALAEELTVPETYFFRNVDQFRALQEQVLPDRLRASATRRSLSILSAGCASGEEAYSIAMALHGRVPGSAAELSIHAIDLNPAMIEKARRARYTQWSLRETPAAMQACWFRPEGHEFVLDDAVRAAVAFEPRNLHLDDAGFWRPGRFDVVFCRNVLMYFTPSNARAAIRRITRSLAPGGVLFLGHAETLRGLSQDFHLRHTHGTFYYQRKDSLGPEWMAQAPAIAPAARAAEPEGAGEVADRGDGWIEAIGQAAERIRLLTEPPVSTGEHHAVPAVPGRLEHALELLRQERFADALPLVQALPADSARDPDVLLLHAVLLVHRGQLQQAEAVCHRLLSIDGLNAGAHYVLALCREAAGHTAAAAECDQVAIYLDPTFAMPRLHLGLLARRAGEHQAARRELEQAVALLRREDASRLLLFGGGFDRSGLLALCHAELRALGGVTA